MNIEFKKLQLNNSILLSTLFNARVGASEIKLKRQLSEISVPTESILKLRAQKNYLLDQLHIEDNRKEYLQSIETGSGEYIKSIEIPKSSKSLAKQKQQPKKKEETKEKILLHSISTLRDEFLGLSIEREEKTVLLNRLSQCKLAEQLENIDEDGDGEDDDEGELSRKRLLGQVKKRDQFVETCLKLVSEIEKNNDEIFKLRQQRSKVTKENREVYNRIVGEINYYKVQYDEDLAKYKTFKKKTQVFGFVVQNLIYGSGIDWTENRLLMKFFESLNDIDHSKEFEEFEEKEYKMEEINENEEYLTEEYKKEDNENEEYVAEEINEKQE